MEVEKIGWEEEGDNEGEGGGGWWEEEEGDR